MQQVPARRRVELHGPRDLREARRTGQRTRTAVEVADAELLERVECDPAVGRQLASGHAQHPGRSARVDGLPARVRGRARAARQDAQPPERRAHRAEIAHGLARLLEDRPHVLVGDASVLRLAFVQRVGRAEQELPLPGDREADAHLVVRDRHRGAPALATVDDQVHALAQAHRRRGALVLEPPDLVEPRSGCVDDQARRHTHGLAVDEHVGAVVAHGGDLAVVEDDRVPVGGTAYVRDGQAAVVRPRVRVERRGMQSLGAQLRHETQRALRAHAAVQLGARERRVEEHARAHHPGPVGPAAIEREEKRQPLHEVRRDDAHQVAPLLMRLANEAHVAHLQVAQAAVDELRRGTRRRAGEVASLDERYVQTVRGRGLGDPGADDPAADHEQVEPARGELLDRCYAIHSGFVQARLPLASATSMRP